MCHCDARLLVVLNFRVDGWGGSRQVVDGSLAFFHELVCSYWISTAVVDESAFSSSASNPDISRPSSLRDGGEDSLLFCARAPFGACLEWRGVHRGGSVQVSVHFRWRVFKLGCIGFRFCRDVGNSRCHYVECSVFFFFFCLRPVGLRWAQFLS